MTAVTLDMGRTTDKVVSLDVLKDMLDNRYTKRAIASHFEVSESHIKKIMCNNGLRTFADMSNDEIEEFLLYFAGEGIIGPEDGILQVQAAFEAEGLLRVGRDRVRNALLALWPEQVAHRFHWSRNTLHRREIYAPYFKWSWHTDLNCKLAMIGIIISGCVDAATRLLIWLEPIIGFGSKLTFNLFNEAQKKYGMPGTMVFDKGSENVVISFACHHARQVAMLNSEQTNRPAAYPTTSQHNIPIEKFWIESNVRVCMPIVEFIEHLQAYSPHLLNGAHFSDEANIGMLNMFFMPIVKEALDILKHTRNHRRVKGRTGGIPWLKAFEGPQSPYATYYLPESVDYVAQYEQQSGRMLTDYGSPPEQITYNQCGGRDHLPVELQEDRTAIFTACFSITSLVAAVKSRDFDYLLLAYGAFIALHETFISYASGQMDEIDSYVRRFTEANS